MKTFIFTLLICSSAFAYFGFGFDRLFSNPLALSSLDGINESDEGFSNTRSMVFDGAADPNNEYVNVIHAGSLDLLIKMTVSCWVKRAGAGKIQIFANSWTNNGSAENKWAMEFNASDRFKIFLSVDGVASNGKVYTESAVVNPISAGTWAHVAFALDGDLAQADQMVMYVNGAEATVTKSQDDDTTSLNSINSPVRFGEFSEFAVASNPYEGNIDECSIWSAKLTDSEINEIYNGSEPADLLLHSQAAALEGWWRFGDDDDTITNIIDNSTNNKPGVHANMEAADIVADVP